MPSKLVRLEIELPPQVVQWLGREGSLQQLTVEELIEVLLLEGFARFAKKRPRRPGDEGRRGRQAP